MKLTFHDGPVREMLVTIMQVLQHFDVDFFVVGAWARDIRLSADSSYRPKRQTLDADIAVMLGSEEEFYKVKQALLATGEFTAHDREAIKLWYRQAIELDLMPFGEIENEDREVTIRNPHPFVMGVPGLREVLPDAAELSIDNLTFRVCSLEGIVLLKIIANDDKPHRTKDLADIKQIIDAYYFLNMDYHIYEKEPYPTDLYDTDDPFYLQKVSGRCVGREIARLLADSPALKERVLKIVSAKVGESYWPEIAAGIRDNQI